MVMVQEALKNISSGEEGPDLPLCPTSWRGCSVPDVLQAL
jgi:hypothetical protein